ncbi:MAG: hypothetical protein BGO51_24120 [Rhodospirillales bacterium 69-11]|nr:DUF3313 domain-containing protein [Rhodospirillales bacterium]MBN8928338.1 DUF3313 domain-containing protein [Rhodospirillales bacterium]OJW22329.1 MAG: hypothetical protein BGO51_24120 [Rhodospirillales bacterium 69-11]
MPLHPATADSAFGADGNTLVFRANDADFSQYRAIAVLPTKVYDGADTDWGGTSPQERAELAQQVTTDFAQALRKAGHLAARPGPRVLALQLTLAGISATHSAASLTRLTPVGLGMSLVRTAEGAPAAFTGSITLAGKLTDGRTGAVLGGFLTRESPAAFDLRSSAGTMTTASLAAAKAADDFARAVDRAVAKLHGPRAATP